MLIGGSKGRQVEEERDGCVDDVEEIVEEVESQETVGERGAVVAGALVGGGEHGAAGFEDDRVEGSREKGEEAAGGGVWVRGLLARMGERGVLRLGMLCGL